MAQAVTVAQIREQLSDEENLHFSDEDCQRFLIARKFVLNAAVEMLQKCFQWRNEGNRLRNQIIQEK